MNIFFLDKDPKICAQYHCDKHVVKMIVELAQLLSTVHRVYDGIDTVITNPISGKQRKILLLKGESVRWLIENNKAKYIIDNTKCYKSTHINHPSCLWIRQSSSNYYWTYKLLVELLNEYTFRFKKNHKTEELKEFLSSPPQKIPIDNITPQLLAMNDEYKIKNTISFDDGIDNYRNYYQYGKSHLFKWTLRDKPEWLKIA